MIRKPVLTEIIDTKLRKILQDLNDDLNNETVIRGNFKLLTIGVNKAETNLLVAHGLKYQPQDVIVTYKSGSNTYTINYDSFDATNISITTTGAMNLRMLIGRIN